MTASYINDDISYIAYKLHPLQTEYLGQVFDENCVCI